MAKMLRWLLRKARQSRPDVVPPYGVFTREFDQTVRANDLDRVLGPLSPMDALALAEAWKAFQGALQGWRARLHVSALEASSRVRAALNEEARKEIVVAILIDQSGSMRGQSMLLAAAAADVAQNFLLHLGTSVEVLGFTTVRWHGGRSRRKWLWSPFKRKPPGRLCDLLHIIYQSSDTVGTPTGGPAFMPMLRPDLPKENVDGEALEWAAGRLRSHDRPRKILLVISDGAPVDDSTLSHNYPTILVDHVQQVIGDLEASSDIELAAIGIGFDVDRYYATSATVKVPEDLGEATIAMLERLIAGCKERSSSGSVGDADAASPTDTSP